MNSNLPCLLSPQHILNAGTRPISSKKRALWSILAAAIALSLTASTLYAQTSSDPWQTSQLIKPETLAKILSQPHKRKPMILYVGFPFFYEREHIVNAVFAGPASKPAGIEELKKVLGEVPRTQEVVMYCGCCPWKECPNIRPAFRTLTEMGFKHIRVLEIPRNFHTDWVEKKYPIEPGNTPPHG